MAKYQKSFIKGRMNKDVDERLLPEGEYVDAQNLRLGATETSEVGAGENTKGNVRLTQLKYKGVLLSDDAVCVGAFSDDTNETMIWCVHDPSNTTASGGVVDMIVSFNTSNQQLTYHVVTASSTTGPTTSVLNFNPSYLVNGMNLIDNLFFFTDDYNPPRKINLTSAYPQPNATHNDQIQEIDISVIKPQPLESPTLTLQANQANDNFMEDTFLCFATRYKYKDGEYSATSQFSDPAFIPSDFALERRSFMNGGMENSINSVVVGFNTGSSNVIGVDILFKEMDSNTIWVAKKLNKETYGYQDNSTESLTFSNGDIYTILKDGEALRLFDNVPRLAKAQTIMGNRLMYGNYLEGYDLKDDAGNDIQLTYNAEQESEAQSSFAKEENRSCAGCLFPPPEPPSNPALGNNYGISGAAEAGFTDVDNEILVDLSAIPIDNLVDGALISIAVEVRPSAVFTSNPSGYNIRQFYYPFVDSPNEIPSDQIPTTTVEFGYTVIGDHTTIQSAFSGTSWEDQIGTSGNYQQSPSNWSSGFTFTDSYNSSVMVPYPIDNTYDDLVPLRSAWQNPTGNDPIRMYVDGVHLHVLPNGFNYNYANLGPNDNIYMIPELVSVRVTFKKNGTQKSLHSNRDYQVGIVYQDAEGRQTTALESKLNSFHVSAYDSENINWAKITIPQSMKPPYWADRYKFVMKQTETDYDTIYSTTYFREVLGTDATDTRTGRVWARLEGENSNKVTEGQELYVKLDYAGATDNPVKTTVLEVKSMAEGDIYETINTDPAPTPAGVYMLIVPDNFTISFDTDTSVLTNGKITEKTRNGKRYPNTLKYPLHDDVGAWQIPEGTTVKIKTHLHRREYDRIEQDVCGRETCNFEFEGVATQDYDNLRDFFLGEGVNIPARSDCGPWGFDDDSGANTNVFYSDIFDYANPNASTRYTDPANAVRSDGPNSIDENHFQFTEDSTTGQFWFEIQSGTHHCWGGGTLARASKIECEISIYPANAALVFETMPTTTTGEIYYENGESFQIVNGNHLSGGKSGDVDQIVGSTSGVVNLGFFNCYTFFNGVESYKYKDSITGKKIYLGNRVTAVSDQDYKAIRRDASITYSGIYNEQSNVNRLNEFNLGLANYKDCEVSYGPIQVLHARTTSLLTIQEDRISYIGQGQHVLNDAAGGGVLVSVPEVLGTQVPRIEEFGISENPESFAHYGKEVYFADAKRASIIQLKGGEGMDALNVVSSLGMRTWFRDLFKTSFNRQKLGGYDPYNNEYVLAPKTTRLPVEVPRYGCGGTERTFTGLEDVQTFIVDMGQRYGEVTVVCTATNEVTITATYNGTVHTGAEDPSGTYTITFDKDVPSITDVLITITPIDISTSSVTTVETINCPEADQITIVPVVLTSADNAGETRHQEFRFQDSLSGYLSPLWSQQDVFISQASQSYTSGTLVTRFNPFILGAQGSGVIPFDNSTISMYSKKIAPQDTFTYDLSKNNMRYLRTATPYGNNAADIDSLLSNSIELTNVGVEALVQGVFNMPSGGIDEYLYLIWDYRNSTALKLCYSDTPSVSEACCECFSSPSCVPFLGSGISSVDSATACGNIGDDITYYFSSPSGNVDSVFPVLGSRIWPASGCGNDDGRRFQGGFISFDDNGTNKWIEIDGLNNVVIDSGNC